MIREAKKQAPSRQKEKPKLPSRREFQFPIRFDGDFLFRLQDRDSAMMILKLVMFYGGALTALVATIFLWLFWRPELKVQTFCDDSAQIIRCAFRATRTLSPIRVTGIWIPVEYVEALEASPPAGFREKLDRMTPVWLYDNVKREVLIWSGRLEVLRGQTVELSIPAKRPKAISGTLHLSYEYRGVGGVLISSGSVDVPLNKDEA